ncbi:MAG: hypothetical protein RQ826_08435 [Xanthomonadales bacterium]|nr:hypothetical protein [Xanthomonadales bacterium]
MAELQVQVSANTQEISDNAASIAAIGGHTDISGLSNAVAALQDLLSGVRREFVSDETNVGNDDGTLRDTLIFEGMNLQIINGEGTTTSTNGLGNLIIGYNEERWESDASETCPASWDSEYYCNRRTGSHMLVLGDWNNYIGSGGAVAGSSNETSNWYASVSGGAGNIASGLSSSVSGGSYNSASDGVASVSGGYQNSATGIASSVTGGFSNTAGGEYSVVVGGLANTASGNKATVGGGRDNLATAEVSSVGAGKANTASGIGSSVSGGFSNTASGSYASVSGGANKIAEDTGCVEGSYPTADC